jgi:GTP cyclohydrolase I
MSTTDDFRDLLRSYLSYLTILFGWKFTEEEKENTPDRVIKMYQEWKGYADYDKMTTFPVPNKFDSLIALKGIKYGAICSHHLMPFFGTVDIVYLPSDVEFGMSKLARIVAKNSYRPQSQEKLTEDIAQELMAEGKLRGVLVRTKGVHTCSTMRGVKQTESEYIVSAVYGELRTNSSIRDEAYQMIM